jgi:Tol biopolymer transport system component
MESDTIRPDGSDFRQVSTRAGYSLGSPKFSLDDTRIVYHEMTRQSTWDAHRPEDANTVMSQIVSVNFITGLDRIEETSGPGLKMHPQYISNNNIAYLVKFGSNAGLNYTKPDSDHVQSLATVRSPSWSPDGLSVVYEKPDFTVRALEKPLYSWDNDWEYRFTDVFPEISKTGILAMTAKQTGNATSNIVTLNPDGSNLQVIFNVLDKLNLTEVRKGLSGAFQPAWSPDSQWIAFGLGAWFQQRAQETASIYQVTANGSYSEQLTDGSVNSGFPSYSLDGRYIVYRVWGAEFGLRIMDLTDKSIKVLTNDSVFFDNLPHFSPDGTTIVFTRRTEVGQVDDPDRTNYDICTIKPDGTGFRRLTDSGANDAHAVWTEDGRILYNSGMYGFRDECAIYDNTFQPYGQIMIMNADGSNKTMLTDSMWEDSMPIFLPNSILI